MRIVIDTNILVNGIRLSSTNHLAVIHLIYIFEHYLTIDHEGNLLREYIDNVGGLPIFEKWFKEMTNLNLVYMTSGRLSNRITDELTGLKLHEPEDRLLVALALKGDKYVITEDSDFGKGVADRSKDHASVLTYLSEDLGLTVHDSEEALVFIREGAGGSII